MSWAVYCFCLKFILSLEILHSWASSCRGFLLSCGVIGRVGEIARGLKSTWFQCLPAVERQAGVGFQWLPDPQCADIHPIPELLEETPQFLEPDSQLVLGRTATAARSCSGHIRKLCVLQENSRPPWGSLDGQLPGLLAPQHHPELSIVAGPEAFHELAWNTNACFLLALNKKLTISNCQYPSPERHATALLFRAYSPLLYLEQFEKIKLKKKKKLSKSSHPPILLCQNAVWKKWKGTN